MVQVIGTCTIHVYVVVAQDMYTQVRYLYILRRTLCKGLMTQRQHLESSTPNKRVVDERPKWRFPNWRFDLATESTDLLPLLLYLFLMLVDQLRSVLRL